MRATHSIQFYCRQSKANKKTGLAHIEASVIINGNRCFINLPREEKPSDFKKAIESKRSNQIKEYIDEVRNKFRDIELDMMRSNIALTSSSLREYFKSGGVKTYNVGDLVDEYLALLKKREGIDLTHSAYKKYQNAFDCFTKFCPKETEVQSLTPATFEKFLVDCNTKYQQSTTHGIMTKVKTLISYARDCGKLNINPMSGLKCSRGKKDIEYLTEEEVKAIYDLKIDNKSLSDVRDAFILQASTGMAYIDTYNLKKEDIQILEDGTHVIVKNRHKTNTQFTTVIMPMGVEVLKKHNYQLHIISNQKYNYFLKSIQGMAGIETNLTTHLARKSFATMCLNKGIRMETVSKMCGHSSVKITEAYYGKLLNQTIIQEAKAVF